MAWDYAELSKMAKDAGGPEKLIDLISEAAKQEGRSEMLPVVGLALGIGVGLTVGIIKLIDFFKRKHKATPDEIAAAKAELIQGIKDYDAAHTDPIEDVISEETDTGNVEQKPNEEPSDGVEQ